MQETMTHARLLGQPRNLPLADVSGRVERGDVRILDKGLADDVDGELLGCFDVVRGVL